MPLTCGARSTVNVDRSTINMDRVQTGLVGPRYGLGFGPPHGMLWRYHVTSLGLYWAPFLGCGRERGSQWTKRRWSMDLRQGAWWTKSTSLSSGMVYEHWVHAWVAREGNFPCFSHGRALADGELVG